MNRRTLLTWVAVVALADTVGCGGSSPSAPSAGGAGVEVQGVVLGDGATFAASSETHPSTAKAEKITVKVDGTTITAEVAANGTFVLKGIPSGTFTLVFMVDGKEIGRITVTAEDGAEVKIVVKVEAGSLVLVEIKVDGPGPVGSPSPTACVISGGKQGQGIELEGVVVAGGSWQGFNMTVNGERGRGLVRRERRDGQLPVHRRSQVRVGRRLQSADRARRGQGPRSRHAVGLQPHGGAGHRGRGQDPEGLMRFGRVLAPAAVLGLVTTLAGAAPRRAAPAGSATAAPAADLFGGYSYTHAGEASLHGWGLSGAYRLRGPLSLVADLTGHYGSFAGADLSQLGFMAGARWTWHAWRLRPFAEGLLGGARTSTSLEVAGASVSDADTDWGLALGGGADFPLNDRWAVRALVHLRLLSGEGALDTDPRLSVGAVYRLGR